MWNAIKGWLSGVPTSTQAKTSPNRPAVIRVEPIIRDLTDQSDIAFQSAVYNDIFRSLTGIGINLAFFTFETSEHSSWARSTGDGRTASYPALQLFLKYDGDFRKTGIDPHKGNWEDEWAETRRIRDRVNTILQRHTCGNEYVSDRAFVFVRTLEQLVFRQIGRVCKDSVRELVVAMLPGAIVSKVFWNGETYNVIMGVTDCKRANDRIKTEITNALPELLKAADVDGCCQSYTAAIEFSTQDQDWYFLMREDIVNEDSSR